MELNVEISQEAFEKLKRQARKTGISVEIVAGRKLSECLVDNTVVDDNLSRRWSNNGKPWDLMTPDEITACYSIAYTAKPVTPDEFAWHQDDITTFEEQTVFQTA